MGEVFGVLVVVGFGFEDVGIWSSKALGLRFRV